MRSGLEEAAGKPLARETQAHRCSCIWTRGQQDPKSNSHPGGVEVDATGGWGGNECVMLGEIWLTAYAENLINYDVHGNLIMYIL